jgi:hypothetical protein
MRFRPVHRAATFTACFFAIAVTAPNQALAAEGAQIHYLLGSTGFQAGLVPPESGTYFKNQAYFYDGEIGAVLRGGQLIADAKESEFIDLLYFTRVTDLKVAGGNVAFTAIVPFLNTNVVASLGHLSREQSDGGFSDLCLAPSIGWNSENCHWFVGAEIYAPTGAYAVGSLAYTGLGYWTVGPNAGFTYLNKKTRCELSLFTGVDFNTMHAQTNYQSGDVFHLDFLAARHFSNGLAIGVNGYYYDQFTNDSGSGALLGGFQGQAASLGPAVQYVKKLGGREVAADFKYFREFDVRKTFQGNLYVFDVSFKF